MIKNIIYLPTFLAVILCSCSKNWLDEKPDSSIAVPKSLKDFEALLDDAVQMNLNSPDLPEIGCDDHYITESNWKNSSISDVNRNAYTWSNERRNASAPEWGQSYNRILYCNIVLEGLSKYVQPNVQEKDRFNNVWGNALFHRAKNFYELAQVWSPKFENATAGNDLGIHLRLQSDINVKTTRTTNKETYEQIIRDIKLSSRLLAVKPLYKTRASKPAAFALLARIFLSMGDYVNAGNYADSCLLLYNSLMNYHTLPSLPNPFVLFNEEVIFHNTLITTGAIRNSIIDPDLYSLYSSNDLRKTLFFNRNNDGTYRFKGSYAGTATRYFGGLAVDEQYLIRAECCARAGKVLEAMADLNKLLKSRWDSNAIYNDITAIDAEDALRKVLLERRKELLMRGLRWSDLRRLNGDIRFAITITRTVNGQTYTLKPNSYKYTFPIPDDIIQRSGIEQNSGWE